MEKIWIQFPNYERFCENERGISETIERFPGGHEIVVYLREEHSVRNYSQTVSAAAGRALTALYGAENVKAAKYEDDYQTEQRAMYDACWSLFERHRGRDVKDIDALFLEVNKEAVSIDANFSDDCLKNLLLFFLEVIDTIWTAKLNGREVDWNKWRCEWQRNRPSIAGA